MVSADTVCRRHHVTTRTGSFSSYRTEDVHVINKVDVTLLVKTHEIIDQFFHQGAFKKYAYNIFAQMYISSGLIHCLEIGTGNTILGKLI